MLCRAIAEKGLENIKGLIKDAEMAEIRLEKTLLTVSETKELFAAHTNLIATCRPDGLNDFQRKEILMAAIDGGAQWIDLEIESESDFCSELVSYAKKNGCKVIISYHNYDLTPDSMALAKIIAEALEKQADLVKIATQVNSISDNARLLSLYGQETLMLAIGMGELGKITRLAALKLGAPFTFVSWENGKETAPGQIQENDMKYLLKYL
ncbi:MAG: type I 3-dehydroquinate dehydratase [Salinivirgaceae bacterium]|jgi:3-dehydroquinate dehydratase/shikimate dehydrogenase